MIHKFLCCLVVVGSIVAGLAIEVDGADSLSIDRFIDDGLSKANVQPSPICDDATFVRRIYLDLIGRIPTSSERHTFLSDSSDRKRERLVDQLLASPEYGRYFREVFDVVFMGRARRGASNDRVRYGWHSYLEHALNEDRPWNQVVRELVVARSSGPDDRGANWFLYERDGKHQDIAEAISAAIFGVQIQCAQCHDHPLASEIGQRHYWGLVAFFNRSKNDLRGEVPHLAESAIGGFNKYASLTGESADAALIFLGDKKVDEKRPAEGQKEEDSVDLYLEVSSSPRVPRFSRRERFADEILKDNPLVAKAMVNRLWGMLLGRGLVHPLDKIDSLHAPSHPELFDWLAVDFQQHDYRLKHSIRLITSSNAYQRSSIPDKPEVDPSLFSYSIERPLTAECLYRSTQVALRQSTDVQIEKDVLGEFVRVFPDVLAEESIPNLRQSMFFTNSPNYQRLFDIERLANVADTTSTSAWIEQVFIALLGRVPDPDEVVAVEAEERERLRAGRSANDAQSVRRLAWALATSAEFRFNH